MQKRYKYKPYNGNYYLVECPKCKKEAMVHSVSDSYCPSYDKVEFTCNNCMYHVKLSDTVLYRATVKRNCPECGKEIYTVQDNFKSPPDELGVTCENCEFKADYIPSISSYTFAPDLKGLKGDRFFSYPLWLQTEVKGNFFWAYNREHLAEIRNYVESDLRENKCTYHMTMVNRLPEFSKAAKNRDAALKAIEKMLNR